MKRDLRRIEATLQQLSKQGTTQPNSAEAISITDASPASTRAVSFDLSPKSGAKKSASSTHEQDLDRRKAEPISAERNPQGTRKPVPEPIKVEANPFLTPPSVEGENLNLPKFKLPSFTSHRNATNPALASSLLKEILTIVEEWQSELAAVHQDIQALYAEGPIVDGWLESYADSAHQPASVLRHAEVEDLMSFVEEICANPTAQTTHPTPKPGYRLCGLNPDGSTWSTPCPPDQLPSVSIAIARHHKLRQYLARKQFLDHRLNQLSESLVVMHGDLKEP